MPVAAPGSAAVERAVRILDFLATHPGQAFTMSELSRRLWVSKATAHSLLASLTANGYLVRDPASQRYELGPGLISLGAASLVAHPAVTRARQEAERLAELLDVQALVTSATASEMLTLTHSGVPRPSSFSSQPGQRLPITPPMGTPFLAWAGEERIRDWLEQLGDQPTEEDVAYYRAALVEARRRGYAVTFKTEAYARLSKVYANARAELHTPEARTAILAILQEMREQSYLLLDLEQAADQPLRVLAVPIFDHHGELLLSLSLLLDDRFTGKDVPAIADHGLRAAARVMASINGRHPDVAYLRSDHRIPSAGLR